MNELQECEVCIIGSGPGGYIAAIQAGRNGARTILVERDFLGGTCLNWGCIPTKTLIASAEALSLFRKADELGIAVNGSIVPDWQKMQKRKNNIVLRLRNGISELLKNAGVSIVNGTAIFNSDTELNLVLNDSQSNVILTPKKIIIATGTKPIIPGSILKSPRILDSTAILNMNEIPKSLIIVGGGIIGCEFASLFAALGTKVSIVEMAQELLPEQDIDISKQVAKEFKRIGMQVWTGHSIRDIQSYEDFVLGRVGEQEIKAQYILVATGRAPTSSLLELKNAGVAVDDKGFITVNAKCETNVENIYAVGDVTGRVQLAHMASAMGICAAKNATGNNAEFSDKIVPGSVFTSPEISSVGLTQQYCDKNNIAIKSAKFPFSALGKAITINETTGFCKVIADKTTDKILGVHIIGAHATDLISEAALAMDLNVASKDIGKVIHPHPTLGEVFMESARAISEECMHLPIKK